MDSRSEDRQTVKRMIGTVALLALFAVSMAAVIGIAV